MAKSNPTLWSTSLVLTFIVFLLQLISGGGGGLLLPPFQASNWLESPSSTIGIYGGCLRPVNATDHPWTTLTPNWQNAQSQGCINLFKAWFGGPNSTIEYWERKKNIPIQGLLSLNLSTIITSILGLSTILSSLSFIVPTTAKTSIWLSLILQAIGTSLAFFWFQDQMGIFNGIGNQNNFSKNNIVRFGYGFWIAVGNSGLLLMAGIMCSLGGKYKRRSSYDSFSDSSV